MLGRRVAPLARRIGLATALAISAPVAVPAQTGLMAAGTEFVLTTPGGRALHSADLVGATLNIAAAGRWVEVTIRSVEEDRDAVRGRVLLHHFVVKDEAGRQVDMCAPAQCALRDRRIVPHQLKLGVAGLRKEWLVGVRNHDLTASELQDGLVRLPHRDLLPV